MQGVAQSRIRDQILPRPRNAYISPSTPTNIINLFLWTVRNLIILASHNEINNKNSTGVYDASQPFIGLF